MMQLATPEDRDVVFGLRKDDVLHSHVDKWFHIHVELIEQSFDVIFGIISPLLVVLIAAAVSENLCEHELWDLIRDHVSNVRLKFLVERLKLTISAFLLNIGVQFLEERTKTKFFASITVRVAMAVDCFLKSICK